MLACSSEPPGVGSACAVSEAVEHRGYQVVERDHRVGETSAHNESGHAPDNARCFVLGDDAGAGGLEYLCTTQAILAHAGQDHADSSAAVNVAHGFKEHVDGRATGIA